MSVLLTSLGGLLHFITYIFHYPLSTSFKSDVGEHVCAERSGLRAVLRGTAR